MIETGATAGGCPHAPASELGPRGRVGERSPSRSGARRARAGRRAGGSGPRQGQSCGRSVRGAPRTAKLSPPPEVRGAEEAGRGRLRGVPGGPRLPELQEEAPGGAGGAWSAPPPSPVPARPRRASRTHLAVELADRHDRAGRAEPRTPCPAGCPLARSLVPRRAAGPGSSLPRWLSVHGRPAWRHLPGLAESWYASRPFPPTCPAGFLEAPQPARSLPARPLLPRRRPGRSGARAGGRGRRPRGAAPRSGMGGRRCPRGAGGPAGVCRRRRRLCAPRGRAGRALPRARRRGVLRPGGGAGEERAAAAPCWTPGARGTGARRLPHLPRRAPGPRGLCLGRLRGDVVRAKKKREK